MTRLHIRPIEISTNQRFKFKIDRHFQRKGWSWKVEIEISWRDADEATQAVKKRDGQSVAVVTVDVTIASSLHKQHI